MTTHPVRGKTIVFTFSDGPVAGKSFEHTFHADGSLDFGMPGSDKKTRVAKYEVAKAGDEVYAVSYLGDSGYTLTCVLDLASGKLVAFSSNEKELILQHGTFAIA